ncbi:hypothetical protein BGY98DRAFT_1103115 [Russula aff. rugulosa BPL654]|nr:hypothetical protein BGY98DRAFT_1103115 [Russula aff. rugulosa BPL654]
MSMTRWYPLAHTCVQPPLSHQPPQLWATLTKQEEEIGELAQEDEDDEIDELAVDDDPGRDGDGPSAKKLFGFELDDIRTEVRCLWLVRAQFQQL